MVLLRSRLIGNPRILTWRGLDRNAGWPLQNRCGVVALAGAVRSWIYRRKPRRCTVGLAGVGPLFRPGADAGRTAHRGVGHFDIPIDGGWSSNGACGGLLIGVGLALQCGRCQWAEVTVLCRVEGIHVVRNVARMNEGRGVGGEACLERLVIALST